MTDPKPLFRKGVNKNYNYYYSFLCRFDPVGYLLVMHSSPLLPEVPLLSSHTSGCHLSVFPFHAYPFNVILPPGTTLNFPLCGFYSLPGLCDSYVIISSSPLSFPLLTTIPVARWLSPLQCPIQTELLFLPFLHPSRPLLPCPFSWGITPPSPHCFNPETCSHLQPHFPRS